MTVTYADKSTATTTENFTTTGSDFTALGPVRVLDTRDGTGTGDADSIGVYNRGPAPTQYLIDMFGFFTND